MPVVGEELLHGAVGGELNGRAAAAVLVCTVLGLFHLSYELLLGEAEGLEHVLVWGVVRVLVRHPDRLAEPREPRRVVAFGPIEENGGIGVRGGERVNQLTDVLSIVLN